MNTHDFIYKAHSFIVRDYSGKDIAEIKAKFEALYDKYEELLKLNNNWRYVDGTIDWNEYIILTETENREVTQLLIAIRIFSLLRRKSWAIFTGTTCLCPSDPASGLTLYFCTKADARGYAIATYRNSDFDWCIVEQGEVIEKNSLKLFHEIHQS